MSVPQQRKKKGRDMSQHFLSDEVCSLLQAYYTCEFTTVNSKGQPVTCPCLAYFHPETGQILVTASIAFRVKALNARRHPKVSLLYSDPGGSGLTTPPALLVQGEASVEELLDHTNHKMISLYKVIQKRQPENRNFMRNRLMRKLFTWYLFQRLVVTVTPQHVRLWPDGNFHAAPTDIEMEVPHVE
jgi:hypothetical protein